MSNKVSRNKVCSFLPKVGKKIHTKVEKDFTAILAISGMVSNSDMCLCKSSKILEKPIKLGSKKIKKLWHTLCMTCDRGGNN